MKLNGVLGAGLTYLFNEFFIVGPSLEEKIEQPHAGGCVRGV